jgi:hypothetical protein
MNCPRCSKRVKTVQNLIVQRKSVVVDLDINSSQKHRSLDGGPWSALAELPLAIRAVWRCKEVVGSCS